MRRALVFEAEACDALLGLLRVHAAAEVHRWPAHLSGAFALAIDEEMERLEPTIRTLGVSYECLESHAVGLVDRRPLSRFSDVDDAFHLVACPVAVDVDLDPVRMALERGDDDARRDATEVAHALRTLIAALAHSELLVCHKLQLAGVEQPPDRVLRFVDAYLAAAWENGAAPEPALPSMLPVAIGYEAHPMLSDALPPDPRLPESTEVFRLELELEPEPLELEDV